MSGTQSKGCPPATETACLLPHHKNRMGSFNTTCFASQQTIAPGETCIVIPLIQKSTYQAAQATFRGESFELHGVTSSTCYPTAFWRPMGGFLEARYDDYGRVKLVDTYTNLSCLVDYLHYVLRNTPVVAQGENQYHDLPFDFSAFLAEKASHLGAWLTRRREDPPVPFDAKLFFQEGVACWDYIWDVAFENRLFGADYHGQLRPLSFAVMHKAAHDLLVADTEKCADWDGQSLEQRSFFSRVLAKARTESAERYKDGDPHGMQAFIAADSIRRDFQCVGHFEGCSYPVESSVLPSLVRAHLEGQSTEDKLFDQVKHLLDARYVMAALGRLNIKLTPMVYAGQDYSNEIGRAYARFVRSASAAVNKGRREQD